METAYHEGGEIAKFDDEEDAPVDTWTLEELRRFADLDSVRFAWARQNEWRA